MCVFSWDRWYCGHFRKTRIEYCQNVHKLPRYLQGCDLPCHSPSDDPELNNHIYSECEKCSMAEKWPAQGPRLHYISLQHHRLRARNREYEELGREVVRLRKRLTQLRTQERGNVWERIYSLTQKLLEFEDRYRDIGAAYYGSGWFADVDYVGSRRLSHVESIRDALCGNYSYTERKFFQPWRDLEGSIQVAMSLLSEGDTAKATGECESACTLVRSIERGLGNLQAQVNWLEHLADLDPRGTVGHRGADTEGLRDLAM